MEIVRPESIGLSSERLCRINQLMQKYIDEGKLAGTITLVARDGQVGHLACQGYADLSHKTPMRLDHIFRIYSMTKPITTTALMMLMEEGLFHITDPISRYIPEFKDMQVIARVNGNKAELEPAKSPITIRHLLTHSAGLSYGFDRNDYLDRLYYKHVWRLAETNPEASARDLVMEVAKLPLKFHPGTGYNYSFSMDVIGYLVEVLSGQRFDEFLKTRIFEPLGMIDTDFWVPPEKADRLAHVYGPNEKTGKLKDIEPHSKSHYLKPATFLSGGGGLVSTMADYLRFCQMILQGGELDGQRLLSRKTVEFMTMNHLPAGITLDPEHGIGFGLGGCVTLDVSRTSTPGSNGTWEWGGAASTKYWIDFEENLIAILMVQFMSDTPYPLEADLKNAVYQAIID